jgi:hypothetical protein
MDELDDELGSTFSNSVWEVGWIMIMWMKKERGRMVYIHLDRHNDGRIALQHGHVRAIV